MEECWWCAWFCRGMCCVDCPRKVEANVHGWCSRFLGVPDAIYEVREKRYIQNEH